ncbi:MAG: aldose 1-epimerase family protein [Clostridium sp.]|nr:aldose 1-epimerase family protein [Clostridium sp.]
MNYTLENSKLKITARSHGGEITSIESKADGTQYLWNGNPEYWKYHAPILFPIVGKVNNSKYRVGGKEFELPQHGLARVSEFNMIDKKDDEITFELKYSEDTLKVYPYKFSLKSNYSLENDTVKVTYTVENIDDKTIYFSIGSHPAFMCPIDKNEELTDCYIEFNKEEDSKRIELNSQGYLTHTKEKCLENTTKLKLYKDLFKDDALVFDDLKSNIMTIKSEKSEKSLEFDFTGFPYMGIWAPKDGAPFVCIEPWFGHADYEDFDGDFKEKEGILSLEQGKKFSCTFKVTVR